MKRVQSNGVTLKVWDATLVMQIDQGSTNDPLPLIDEHMTEDEARDYLRKVLSTGLYQKRAL